MPLGRWGYVHTSAWGRWAGGDAHSYIEEIEQNKTYKKDQHFVLWITPKFKKSLGCPWGAGAMYIHRLGGDEREVMHIATQ